MIAWLAGIVVVSVIVLVGARRPLLRALTRRTGTWIGPSSR